MNHARHTGVLVHLLALSNERRFLTIQKPLSPRPPLRYHRHQAGGDSAWFVGAPPKAAAYRSHTELRTTGSRRTRSSKHVRFPLSHLRHKRHTHIIPHKRHVHIIPLGAYLHERILHSPAKSRPCNAPVCPSQNSKTADPAAAIGTDPWGWCTHTSMTWRHISAECRLVVQ